MFLFLFRAVVIGALGGALGIATGVVASYVVTSGGGLHSGPTGAPAGAAFVAGSGGAEVFRSSGGASGQFRPGTSTFSKAPTSTGSPSTKAQPVFTLSVILEAMAIAVGISIIAGIYPEWRASRMEPIDALRTL